MYREPSREHFASDNLKLERMLDEILSDTDEKIRAITNACHLSEEEYYEKLSALRRDQKRLLNIAKDMYGTPELESPRYDKNIYMDETNISNVATENERKTLRGTPLSDISSSASIQSGLTPGGFLSSQTKEPALTELNKMLWKHKITIPEPFKMTQREEAAKFDRADWWLMQAKCDADMEKEYLSQLEMAKADGFRARPIPAHVYLPLYPKIAATNAKSLSDRNSGSRSKGERFECTLRRKKKGNVVRQLTDLQIGCTVLKKKSNAHRIPTHVYENRLEQLKDREILREVLRELRAKRLLNSASLPPGMEEHQRRSEERRKARLARNLSQDSAGSPTAKPNFKARPVPDFKRLHWENSKRTCQSPVDIAEPVRQKPLTLRTALRSDLTKRQVGSQMDKNEQSGTVPIRSRPIQSAECSPPIKARSTVLRENMIRNRQEKAKLKQEELETMQRQKQAQRAELARKIKQDLGLGDLSPAEYVETSTARKKSELRAQTDALQIEYEKQIHEIKEKLNSRPLLSTRQSQDLVRKRVDTKFVSILENAGLNPRELVERHKSDQTWNKNVQQK